MPLTDEELLHFTEIPSVLLEDYDAIKSVLEQAIKLSRYKEQLACEGFWINGYRSEQAYQYAFENLIDRCGINVDPLNLEDVKWKKLSEDKKTEILEKLNNITLADPRLNSSNRLPVPEAKRLPNWRKLVGFIKEIQNSIGKKSYKQIPVLAEELRAKIPHVEVLAVTREMIVVEGDVAKSMMTENKKSCPLWSLQLNACRYLDGGHAAIIRLPIQIDNENRTFIQYEYVLMLPDGSRMRWTGYVPELMEAYNVIPSAEFLENTLKFLDLCQKLNAEKSQLQSDLRQKDECKVEQKECALQSTDRVELYKTCLRTKLESILQENAVYQKDAKKGISVLLQEQGDLYLYSDKMKLTTEKEQRRLYLDRCIDYLNLERYQGEISELKDKDSLIALLKSFRVQLHFSNPDERVASLTYDYYRFASAMLTCVYQNQDMQADYSWRVALPHLLETAKSLAVVKKEAKQSDFSVAQTSLSFFSSACQRLTTAYTGISDGVDSWRRYLWSTPAVDDALSNPTSANNFRV